MGRILCQKCIKSTLEGHIYITIHSINFFWHVPIFQLYLGKASQNSAIGDCVRRNISVFHREGLFLAPPPPCEIGLNCGHTNIMQKKRGRYNQINIF